MFFCSIVNTNGSLVPRPRLGLAIITGTAVFVNYALCRQQTKNEQINQLVVVLVVESRVYNH